MYVCALHSPGGVEQELEEATRLEKDYQWRGGESMTKCEMGGSPVVFMDHGETLHPLQSGRQQHNVNPPIVRAGMGCAGFCS